MYGPSEAAKKIAKNPNMFPVYLPQLRFNSRSYVALGPIVIQRVMRGHLRVSMAYFVPSYMPYYNMICLLKLTEISEA